MSSGELVLPNSDRDRVLSELFREAAIDGDWRRPDVFRSIGKTTQGEDVVEVLDIDADTLDAILKKVEASFAEVKAIPAREEIKDQIAYLQLIDTRIALIDAECTEAKKKLAEAGEGLKEKISNKKLAVQKALEKKDVAIAKFEELKAELQSIPEIVAQGLQALLEDTALQSISDVHSGLGSLGQKSLGNHDIAVKILQLRSAKAVMVNAITYWENETQALEAFTSERTRLITAAELLDKKLEEEKKSRKQYVESRVIPAGHLVTETTRRDRFAYAINGLGASAVGLFRRNRSQQDISISTQLIAGVDQNGGI
jgi:hypothetical protein